jgi:Ca2+-binding RTX toxin-like protein
MAVKRGTNGADKLTGGSARDYVFGLLGDDQIKGAGGDDSLSGNAGDDRLSGDAGDDEIRGGAGKDTLEGGEGHDLLDGGDDQVADRLNGGAGHDVIFAYAGDVVDGGADEDTLTLGNSFDFEAAPKLYAVDLSGIGGASASDTGFEGVTAMNVENAVVNLFNAKGGSSVIGSTGDDTISGGSIEQGAKGLKLSGGAGDDQIFGSDKADTIKGDAGTDILSGGAGADKLAGGKGADLFVATLEGSFPGGPTQAVDQILDYGKDDFILIQRELVQSPFIPSFSNADQDNPVVSGVNPTATSDKGQFLFDTQTKILSYDADGTGGQHQAVALFKMVGVASMDATDFIFDL